MQATTRAAFSSDLRVTTSRARMFFSSRVITAVPEASQNWSRLSYGAGAPDEFGRARPMASDTHAIVFAVNCPPQAPAEGQATRSSVCSAASDIAPA